MSCWNITTMIRMMELRKLFKIQCSVINLPNWEIKSARISKTKPMSIWKDRVPRINRMIQ